MPNLASIGSVVRIRSSRFIVVGHRMARSGQKVGMCYLLVPYPLGFVHANSLSLTPVSKVDELVVEGLHTKEGDEYLEGLKDLMARTDGIDYDDFADGVLSFSNYLKKEASANE